MDSPPTYLDGNAAAGTLGELFRFEISTAVGHCAGCGEATVLANGRLYLAGPGLVLRCATCGSVLLRTVVAGGRVWMDFMGLSCLQLVDMEPSP